jgi:predicted TIM-barrel fold metal-dependent hydrolase
MSFAAGAQAGKRFEGSERLRTKALFDDVRPGGYLPAEHLKDNAADGVSGSVLYPTAAMLFMGTKDTALLSAICDVYNDWIADFCALDPQRLKGIGLVNIDDPRAAAREIDRCRGLGLAGVLIPVYPYETKPYDSRIYEPLWEAAEAARQLLGLHISTKREGRGENFQYRPSVLVNADYWVRVSLTQLIFGAVFERHPDLHVLCVEHELGWIPYFLDQMDYAFTQRIPREGWRDITHLPSDFWRSNVHVSVIEDRFGIEVRERIGIPNIMWGSDYPHVESTFPRSKEKVAELLKDLPDDEADAIAYQNASMLFGFPEPDTSR